MDVLVVSGNLQVLDAVAAAFADDEVTEVRTPTAALARLKGGEPCTVVVADADTTPEGGFSLTREIKAWEQMGRAMPPVALLIARAQDKWLAEWSGADVIALRPVDPFDLRDAVSALLEEGTIPALPDIVQGGGPMRDEARRIERELSGGPAGGLTGGGP